MPEIGKDGEGLPRQPSSLRSRARVRAWGRMAGRAGGGRGRIAGGAAARKGALGIETRPFAAAGDGGGHPVEEHGRVDGQHNDGAGARQILAHM